MGGRATQRSGEQFPVAKFGPRPRTGAKSNSSLPHLGRGHAPRHTANNELSFPIWSRGPRNGSDTNLSLPSFGRGRAPGLRAITRCHIWGGAAHQAQQLRTSSRFQFGAGRRNGAENNFSLPSLGRGQRQELRAIPRCHIWAGATHQDTQQRTSYRFQC